MVHAFLVYFAAKSRISIPGNVYKEVRSRTKLQRLVFNFPMTENCDAEFCKICLEPEMFTSKSYENWICRNFGFKTGCNIIEVIHDWPKMKQLLGQTGNNSISQTKLFYCRIQSVQIVSHPICETSKTF